MTPISFVNSISRLVFGLRSFGGMLSFSGPKHMRIAFSLGQLIMPSFVALYWVMYLRAMFLSIGCLFAYPHSQYSFVRLPLFVSFTQLNHTKPGLAGNYLAIYRNLWAINFFSLSVYVQGLYLCSGSPHHQHRHCYCKVLFSFEFRFGRQNVLYVSEHAFSIAQRRNS